MGIMVPTSALSNGRWKSSNQLTALHALAAVTLTKSLLYLGTLTSPQLQSEVRAGEPFLHTVCACVCRRPKGEQLPVDLLLQHGSRDHGGLCRALAPLPHPLLPRPDGYAIVLP